VAVFFFVSGRTGMRQKLDQRGLSSPFQNSNQSVDVVVLGKDAGVRGSNPRIETIGAKILRMMSEVRLFDNTSVQARGLPAPCR